MDAFEVIFYCLCVLVSASVIDQMYKGCMERQRAAAEAAEDADDECSDSLALKTTAIRAVQEQAPRYTVTGYKETCG